MANNFNIIDQEPRFYIDATTRLITNELASKIAVIQFDHNSEVFTFSLPRYIENHDMTECDKIEVHYKNTDASTFAETYGVYTIDDMQVDPEDETKALCTWTISCEATQKVGKLEFGLRFSRISPNGEILYAWNTAIFTGITVSPGLYNSENLLGQYVDVIEQWKKEVVDELRELVVNLTNDGTVMGDIVTISDARSIDGVMVNNVENPEEVTVARVGKNIMGLNSSFEKETCGGNLNVTYDHLTQEYTLNGTASTSGAIGLHAYMGFRPYLDEDTVMTLSIEYDGECSAEFDANHVYITDKATKTGLVDLFKLPFKSGKGSVSVTQTVPAGELYVICLDFSGTMVNGKHITFSNYKFKIQLEVGHKATEWEKYQCETYTPNASGFVAGVTPLTPTTTLLKNKANAVIECKYTSVFDDTDNGGNHVACDISKEDVANAVKRTVTGSKLVISDLSPLVDELKVKVTQSYIDSPVIYKRIGENLWNKNITKNDDTGEYDSDLYPCQSGEIYDISEPSTEVNVVNITFYDSENQVVQSGVSVVMSSQMLTIPDNCSYFKVSKAIPSIDGGINYVGIAFQNLLTIYKAERYESVDGQITIPSPFDPVVYLYDKSGTSQFECEYNADINDALTEKWELISSGTLTGEALSLALDGFSCSKVELKLSVASSENNPSESALRLRTNINSNTGGGSDDSLTRMFRTSGANTPALILLEMHNKIIKGQLVNSGVNKVYANYHYSNPSVSEYDSITGVYLQPATSGCVFGAGTTYELWGVRK